MKLKLKKGLKLSIAGGLGTEGAADTVEVSVVAIVPDDYQGFVPKLAAKEGDLVAVGTPLLYDKNHPGVKLVSPMAGTVKAVVRGDRRKILRVEVEAGAGADAIKWNKATEAVGIRALLADSGLLALMRQRPFDIVPNPDDKVRDIFVTAYNTAPLAASPKAFDTLFNKEDYEAGVAALAKVTEGKVYFSHGSDWHLGDLKDAENVEVDGLHPAGNAGVQAANIRPVNKGETIWTLDLATLGRIGKLMRTGVLENRTVVALVGPEIEKPMLLNTVIGAPVEALLKGRIKNVAHNQRIISGNVLTGEAVDAKEGYLHYPYNQITVIAEGDDVNEFMGWASFAPSKMSESPTFPGHFLKRLFKPDARLNGSRRAMIVSGQYESMMPMDVMPEYLIKAILAKNIEDMEKLGIYEVAPEDFAAAEYADTSKIPLQQIVREGLDYLRKELE